MTAGRFFRLAAVIVLLLAGFIWIHRTAIDLSRVSLYITAVIGAVTGIYVLVTYEILLQNQAMAKAALDSTTLTERGLRFSYTPNLLYQTLDTKDPTFQKKKDIIPVPNDDYRAALAEYSTDQQQKEFIFAIVKNVGRGIATNLKIVAQYDIVDNSSVAKKYSVTRDASIQMLEPDHAIALMIFFSKVPTRDDYVRLVAATLATSDFYRDALGEPVQEIVIESGNHHADREPDCLIQLG
jgi:hypothetical protein